MRDRKEFVGMVLAESGSVLPAAHSPHVKNALLLDLTRSRWARLKPLVLAIYYSGTVMLLAAAGYPRNRLLGLIAVFGTSLVMQLAAFACIHTRAGLKLSFHGQFWHIGFL